MSFVADDKSIQAWKGEDWIRRAHSVGLSERLDIQDADLTMIKRSIRPEVLMRIPPELQTTAGDLLKAVPRFSAPFNIAGLPPELRLRIYEFTGLITTLDMTEPKIRMTPRFPALAQSSATLRKETYPAIMKQMRIKVDINDQSLFDWIEERPQSRLVHYLSDFVIVDREDPSWRAFFRLKPNERFEYSTPGVSSEWLEVWLSPWGLHEIRPGFRGRHLLGLIDDISARDR